MKIFNLILHPHAGRPQYIRLIRSFFGGLNCKLETGPVKAHVKKAFQCAGFLSDTIRFSVQEYEPYPAAAGNWPDCAAMCASKLYNGVNCNVFWISLDFGGTFDYQCHLGTYYDVTTLVSVDSSNSWEIRALNIKKALP